MMLLSVIVPVYNAEKYLNMCIDSILNQTYKDFEVILIDDGSEDNSGRICDEYATCDSRVKVVHSSHRGVICARKLGVGEAVGEYITFVDGDDWIDEDMYEKMLREAEKNNADIVICEMLRETHKGRFVMPNCAEKGVYDKKRLEESFYPDMLFSFEHGDPAIRPSLCNKLIKKEILEKVIFHVNDTIVFGEDALISYPAMLLANSIYITDRCYYHYRQNFKSVTNVYDKKLLGKFLLLHDELKKQFEKLGFDEGEQLMGYVASYSISCIRKELLKNPLPLKKRINTVKNYVRDERVASALASVEDKFGNTKTGFKVRAMRKEHFFTLYVLFALKEMILKLRGYRYED